MNSNPFAKLKKTNESSSGKTKFSLTKNSVGNWWLDTKGSPPPTALLPKKGKFCLMRNSSTTLKITGEKCGLRMKTLPLNRFCVIWLRNQTRIRFCSHQTFHLSEALTFGMLLLAGFTRLQARTRGQTRKSVSCRTLVLTILLLGLTGMSNQIGRGHRFFVSVLLPKKFPAQGIADFRPISIGSNWYRLWSSIRIRQLSVWIKNLAGNEFHGGIRGRSPFTALIHPLCELQHTQKLDSARIMHPVRDNLRYIGASDLSKAYDRMHGHLAGESLTRLGVPGALARTWEKAWIQQSRFFQFGEQTSKKDLGDIKCLPQGDPASPVGLLGPLWEAQCRLKKKFNQRQWGRSEFRVFIDDRSWFSSKPNTCVPISKEWKAEVKLLGLNENKCKSEFAAVGKISHRRALNLQIRAAGLDGSCLDRPKILGTRFECTRAWLGPKCWSSSLCPCVSP